MLRARGARIVLITGARTSTLLQRAPHLPPADAYVSENGGRIFYPRPDGAAAGAAAGRPSDRIGDYEEDGAWRDAHAPVAGPSSQDGAPPEGRAGPLWAWFRQLAAAGWALDANSYATAFRLSLRGSAGKAAADLGAAVAARPPGVECSENVGALDFYPATSGKHLAAAHLMARFGAPAARCAFLCDDDNDLLLAAAVGRAFLPTVATASVRAAVAAAPDHFVVSSLGGTAATEEMVAAVGAHLDALPPL